MPYWKWFGNALLGSALAASTATFLERQFLHASDSILVGTMATVFFAAFSWGLVAKIRFDAWRRQYLLSEDFARWEQPATEHDRTDR